MGLGAIPFAKWESPDDEFLPVLDVSPTSSRDLAFVAFWKSAEKWSKIKSIFSDFFWKFLKKFEKIWKNLKKLKKNLKILRQPGDRASNTATFVEWTISFCERISNFVGMTQLATWYQEATLYRACPFVNISASKMRR
jgi:hypothetical protein